jgi:hypothetical protein
MHQRRSQSDLARQPPFYLGFFQFMHNARRRGKALLGILVEALVAGTSLPPQKARRANKERISTCRTNLRIASELCGPPEPL